jgi:hypothetical protein
MNRTNQIKKQEIISSLNDEMNELGFTKKRDSFHRETESGLHQIIDFVLGSPWSTTRNHIGIGFGIATEEWIKYLNKLKRPKVLTTPNCEIRDFYIAQFNSRNLWFDLNRDNSEIINLLEKELTCFIFPFLNKLKTRTDIINQWEHDNESVGLPPRQELSIGILEYFFTDREKAMKRLNDLYIKHNSNSFYTETITAILNNAQPLTRTV